MMKVLVHYRASSEIPVGVWWVHADTLKCVYGKGRESEERVGRLIMSGKRPSLTWQEWFEMLEERLPIGNDWEIEDLKEDPASYLAHYNR